MIRVMPDEQQVSNQPNHPEGTQMAAQEAQAAPSPKMQQLMSELEEHRAETRAKWLQLRAAHPDVLGDRPDVDDLIASYDKDG